MNGSVMGECSRRWLWLVFGSDHVEFVGVDDDFVEEEVYGLFGVCGLDGHFEWFLVAVEGSGAGDGVRFAGHEVLIRWSGV